MNIGQIVYGRRNSSRPPETKYVECTIMQIIASGMVTLHYTLLEEKKYMTTIVLKLNSDNITPAYLSDIVWENWQLIN